MKFFSKFTAVAVLAAASALSAAEVIDLTAKDFWRPMKSVDFSEGQMSNTGRVMYNSKKLFKFDPSKKYTLEMDVATGKGTKHNFFLVGFLPTNEKGRGVSAYQLQCIPASYTELAADVKKGDKVIKVKDASKWIKGGYIAFDAKADFSDIPNSKIFTGGIAGKAKDGDVWTITLSKPVNRDAAAGTFIRQHVGGGYYYLWNSHILPEKNVKVKRTITGQGKHGRYSSKAFHPAVKYGYFIILSDWVNGKTPVTIKNAKLTIE